MEKKFELVSEYDVQGDQEQAINKLTKSIQAGNKHQTLLGVTGSGKTFSMANIIQNVGLPTLVLSHNKTLAAQLFSEFKSFFPNNAVEYFVSYFDYYQPEAYIPTTDTYIEKDSSINDDIERLRLASMGALLSRSDVIIVASVSCIYGLGSPKDYQEMMVPIYEGMEYERDKFLRDLVKIYYARNDIEFTRGKFRVRGDVVDIYPAYLEDTGIRVEFFGDEIERINAIDPLTGSTTDDEINSFNFYPAKQFVTTTEKLRVAIQSIRNELRERIAELEDQNKLVEAQRLKQRTEFDIEMMQELGFCNGIENYTRHLSGLTPGSAPSTLLDFFPKDFLMIIDESHASVPQLHAMYAGNKARKLTLIEHGFRLPSALDNRPLNFEEFIAKSNRYLYVSATPGPFELFNSFTGNKNYIRHKDAKEMGSFKGKISNSKITPKEFEVKKPGHCLVVEQIIRPTGLLDPRIIIKPLQGQIDECIELCRQRIEKNERVLVTTLTKRTAEDLTDYLRRLDLKVRYIHSDVGAIERVEILRGLRNAEFDILVGINLLREGLDLPEVSLVCILDADKEGYLRSETSLIQTAGRAARHENGTVVLFADKITRSIDRLLSISKYRREQQNAYNEIHGITPRSVKRFVQKSLQSIIAGGRKGESKIGLVAEDDEGYNASIVLQELEAEMSEAASKLEFERAALLRDQISELKKLQEGKKVAEVL